MATREPADCRAETASHLEYYKTLFWRLALTHNMASFYVVSPFMIWAFSRWEPQLQAFTPYAYWSLVLFAITVWSWTFALYPIYKIETLTVCRKPVLAHEAE